MSSDNTKNEKERGPTLQSTNSSLSETTLLTPVQTYFSDEKVIIPESSVRVYLHNQFKHFVIIEFVVEAI